MKRKIKKDWILTPGFHHMKFFILKTVSVSLFFMLAFGTFCLNTYGYDGDSPGKWWKNKKIVKQLELSNEQMNRIEGIFSSNKGRIKELDSDLKKKEREFSDTVKNPNSSREEILRMNNEVEEVKGKLRKAYIDMRLQIRDVLTPEQRIKLQEIKTKHGKPYP
ncbi:MAG TPA: Spy/CpxP family protein refolding chaperone [Thermodesulfobacteriota bacterium]|nr:Spy/CpxP family protein refolding chaperone [Thermodesulfobacteriota bacterium]